MKPVVLTRNRQRRWPVQRSLLRAIAHRILARLDSRLETVGIILVNDAQIAGYNEQFHHTDGPTDVLSFDYGDGAAELIISVERAAEQARQFHSTPSRELALYVVHGLLHLHGYDDLTPGPRRRMRAAERRLLKRLARVCPLRGLVGLARNLASADPKGCVTQRATAPYRRKTAGN